MSKNNPESRWLRTLHGAILAIVLLVLVSSLNAENLSTNALGLILVALFLTAVAFGVSVYQIYRSSRRTGEEEVSEPGIPAPPTPKGAPPQRPALMLLSLLQEHGHFLDFLKEDIDTFTEGQICSAARIVHQGCREVVNAAFDPVPVTEQQEKTDITLPNGYSPEEYKVTGKVNGQPPYSGTLVHQGWRARKRQLPISTKEPDNPESPVITPAEVEV
ncbi:MAG: DUF2760 domain-containing protein [Chitinivibrionales bacterium]|nr:DUF2760 domain-containing protein [Chitinivibrionales bacterium]